MECLPQGLPVQLQYRTDSFSVTIRNNSPQFPQPRLAIRHQEQLVRRMKAHETVHRVGLVQAAEPSKRKNTRQKMLADVQILEAAFIFYGQVTEFF